MLQHQLYNSTVIPKGNGSTVGHFGNGSHGFELWRRTADPIHCYCFYQTVLTPEHSHDWNTGLWLQLLSSVSANPCTIINKITNDSHCLSLYCLHFEWKPQGGETGKEKTKQKKLEQGTQIPGGLVKVQILIHKVRSEDVQQAHRWCWTDRHSICPVAK